MSTQNLHPNVSSPMSRGSKNLVKMGMLAVVSVLVTLGITGCTQKVVPLTPPEFTEPASAPTEPEEFEIKDPIQERISADVGE